MMMVNDDSLTEKDGKAGVPRHIEQMVVLSSLQSIKTLVKKTERFLSKENKTSLHSAEVDHSLWLH